MQGRRVCILLKTLLLDFWKRIDYYKAMGLELDWLKGRLVKLRRIMAIIMLVQVGNNGRR